MKITICQICVRELNRKMEAQEDYNFKLRYCPGCGGNICAHHFGDGPLCKACSRKEPLSISNKTKRRRVQK